MDPVVAVIAVLLIAPLWKFQQGFVRALPNHTLIVGALLFFAWALGLLDIVVAPLTTLSAGLSSLWVAMFRAPADLIAAGASGTAASLSRIGAPGVAALLFGVLGVAVVVSK